MNFLHAFQTYSYTILTQNPQLMTLVSGRIYDQPPCFIEAPYIVIGDDHFYPWNSKTSSGYIIYSFIHIWAEGTDKKKIKEIAVLSQEQFFSSDQNLPDYIIISKNLESIQIFHEKESGLAHGILKIKFTLYKENT